jgi:carotenoid cleavage dioxygenase
LFTSELKISGKLPNDLLGTFYRNGPAKFERNGMRYHHWFDGDGMIQAFRFGSGKISHQGKFVQTEKFLAESKAGKFLRSTFGTYSPDFLPLANADTTNTANTNIIPLAGEMLALWEAGSATRIDPGTLATRGVKTWRDDLKGMPFSAHPRFEQDGSLWNFGASTMNNALILYRIAADGTLLKSEVIKIPRMGMIHDFAITERHLVFLLPPLIADREKMQQNASYLDFHTWRPELGLRILTINKSDWSDRRWYQLPAGFVFHIGNAWEDKAGVIRLDYVRSDDDSVIKTTLRQVMQGKNVNLTTPTTNFVTLNPKTGSATQRATQTISEFPRIDSRRTGKRYRHLYTLTKPTNDTPRFDAILRHDLESGHIDSFAYGPRYLVEEHIFVAKPGGTREGEGWLIGTALDTQSKITLLSVFDALHLNGGPMAQAFLPYPLPLGFHGNFVKG